MTAALRPGDERERQLLLLLLQLLQPPGALEEQRGVAVQEGRQLLGVVGDAAGRQDEPVQVVDAAAGRGRGPHHQRRGRPAHGVQALAAARQALEDLVHLAHLPAQLGLQRAVGGLAGVGHRPARELQEVPHGGAHAVRGLPHRGEVPLQVAGATPAAHDEGHEQGDAGLHGLLKPRQALHGLLQVQHQGFPGESARGGERGGAGGLPDRDRVQGGAGVVAARAAGARRRQPLEGHGELLAGEVGVPHHLGWRDNFIYTAADRH